MEKKGRGRPKKADTLHTRSISFPADLYGDVQKIAAREERDVTSQIVKALRDFVAQYKKEHGEDLGPLVPELLAAA
jgi:metal-responsive CopG/Arc/MetJ family transcriptional regulator